MSLKIIRSMLLTGALCVTACGNVQTHAEPQQADAKKETKEKVQSVIQDKIVNGYLEIFWDDLMPPGEEEKLMEAYAAMMASQSAFMVPEGSPGDKANQVGTFNVVEDIDGEKIRIAGYTVPLGSADGFTEFLLVPTMGACLHQPPPPPNQTIYVKSKTPIKSTDLPQAAWVNGIIKTQVQKTNRADTAYIVELDKVEEFQY